MHSATYVVCRYWDVSHGLMSAFGLCQVFQGLLRSNRDYCDTKAAFVRLWIHECLRVFADRLIDTK